MSTPVRIFISYARQDLEHLKALETQLANLKRLGRIVVWTDQQLRPSTEWEPELLKHLRSADIVLVLISPDMMASDFIHDHELKDTLARHQRNQVKLVPVLVRPTDLKGHALDKLQGLPRNFKPVVEWPNRDAAWLDVVQALRELLEPMHTRSRPSSDREKLSSRYEHALQDLKALQQNRAPEHIVQEQRKQAIALRDQLLQGALHPHDIIDGRFRLMQCLGQGGFASVWLAQRLEDQTWVALKILLATLTDNPDRLMRFRRGSEQLSRLKHPHILQVLEPYQVSSDADTGRQHALRHYVVLEWASKGDLALWSRPQKSTLTLDEVLQVGLDAADALGYAHANGCIHRDVKPHNLLRMQDGCLKLTDFDLAKLVNSTLLTLTGTVGTAFYIAPELQDSLDGDETAAISPSVDVYSLGWSLIAVLKGRDITSRDLMKRQQVLEQHKVPEPLQRVLLKAVEIEPADRYPTMTAFQAALLNAREQLSQQSAAATPSSMVLLPPTTPRRGANATDLQQLEAALAALPLEQRLERLQQLGKEGDPRLGMDNPQRWVWHKPGSFMMGSMHGDSDERPVHRVTFRQGFWLGKYPVTHQEYAAFVKAKGYQTRAWWSTEGWQYIQQEKRVTPYAWDDPSYSAPNQPVVGVSWYEAEAFCRWQNHTWEQTPPTQLLEALQLSGATTLAIRLPSEAEWEYAARGEQSFEYPWGNNPEPEPERANFAGQVGRPTPVGAYPLGQSWAGAADLAGNVWERCQDGWHSSYTGAPDDGTAWTINSSESNSHIIRGGSWLGDPVRLRGANRHRYLAGNRNWNVGLRVVLVPVHAADDSPESP